MPYIIRCHVKDTAAVKKAIRTEIIFRGDFAPWNEDADDRWLAGSSDQAPLTRQLLTAARHWVVACYDGARWLVPTVEVWREQG